jgi:hypothetical protein
MLVHLSERPMKPRVHRREPEARATEIMATCCASVNGESIAVDGGICLKSRNLLATKRIPAILTYITRGYLLHSGKSRRPGKQARFHTEICACKGGCCELLEPGRELLFPG